MFNLDEYYRRGQIGLGLALISVLLLLIFSVKVGKASKNK